ncbi:hypothetical protein ACWCYY_36855 [Kitasatospora sp. NPDC001664]
MDGLRGRQGRRPDRWFPPGGKGSLAPDYQRLVKVLTDRSGEVMDCRQLAAALGLEVVAAKVEGVRSKAKRLAARGWLAEERPGMFSALVGRVGGS